MCIIPIKSQTLAARAKAALERARIPADIVAIDPSLTRRGCGYGICLREADADTAESVLRERRIEFGSRLGNSGSGGDA